MNTKHTPGPWFAHENGHYWEIRTEDGEFAGEEVGNSCPSNFLRDGNNGEANARLMAAAPELLEVLKNALGVCQAFSTQSTTAKICADKAESAIRKALGIAK